MHRSTYRDSFWNNCISDGKLIKFQFDCILSLLKLDCSCGYKLVIRDSSYRYQFITCNFFSSESGVKHLSY